MAVAVDVAHRGWAHGASYGGACLGDKFEILKEIGDGSFGSVALGRVRSGGSHIAKRGSMVAVKTMKKTFDSFASCLELREVVFLRTLPNHPHLVPALDIFLDPMSKKLHIAMEYMDGNLYQLMKARDHKPFDSSVVKTIMVQILSGLEHIHDNGFFHRDIKPENILVTVSAREELGGAFKRYSQLITPPSTPPSYTIKIADFGLAREIYSRTPYTTYVSTRWYRAPEVLLRAGEYSAPVDIWALGAMAVEIATLKPLFPGGNEVDQVWRVCEIMGSPGNWVNRHGTKVGGGQWKDGVKLAQKLGFSFPKMAPHTLDTLLPAPQWPSSLCDFITWCLMWDPSSRPTSAQALAHEYFREGLDPVVVRQPPSRRLTRKQSDLGYSATTPLSDAAHTLTSKTSAWFRKSLIARESAPAVPQYTPVPQPVPSPAHTMSPGSSPIRPVEKEPRSLPKVRPHPTKRNTWANGISSGAPMLILPSIRPISPLSNTITAQARPEPDLSDADTTKRVGRQLSLVSRTTHPVDYPIDDSQGSAMTESGRARPLSGQKEGFFSHLRKRARRISGRHQFPSTPKSSDVEASAAGVPSWPSARDHPVAPPPSHKATPVDSAIGDDVKISQSVDAAPHTGANTIPTLPHQTLQVRTPILKRHHSLPQSQESHQQQMAATVPPPFPSSSARAFRVARKPVLTGNQYDAPDEQEEILDEALASAHAAVARLNKESHTSNSAMEHDAPYPVAARPSLRSSASETLQHTSYPTPSPQDKRHTIDFQHFKGCTTMPMDICPPKPRHDSGYPFPTPPYDDNEWAAAAAAAIIGAGDAWR